MVVVLQADVARPEAVAARLSTVAARRLPRGGVVPAGAVLEDHTLLALSAAPRRSASTPTARGAWNLHALTLGKPLDFFKPMLPEPELTHKFY